MSTAPAMRLGIECKVIDRVSYMERLDLPEAEFLATGGPGEDVANTAMELELRRRVLLTGDVGAALYRFGRPRRSDLWRLPVFGRTEIPSLQAITRSRPMRPWSIGTYDDRPIARRIGEEAGGLPRGSFAAIKHASTALIHQDPEGRMTSASLRAVREFAAAEGTSLTLVERKPLRKRERFVIKASHRFHVDRIGQSLADRQWAMIHQEPRQGAVLFRWGVSIVQPRYAALRGLLSGVR